MEVEHQRTRSWSINSLMLVVACAACFVSLSCSANPLVFQEYKDHFVRNQQLLGLIAKEKIRHDANTLPLEGEDNSWRFRDTTGAVYFCTRPAATDESKIATSVIDAEAAEPTSTEVAVFSQEALDARIELLRGTCVSHDGGWWTTRWCHATDVRQAHLEGAREVTSYSLGVFKLGEVKFAEASADSNERTPIYYVETFLGGQICDETGEARKTEVRIHCCPKDKGVSLVSLQETTLCSYTMTLCWASLCDAGLPPLSPNSRNTWAALRPLTNLCFRYKADSGWMYEVCFEKTARAFRQVQVRDLPAKDRKLYSSHTHGRLVEVDAKALGAFNPLQTFMKTQQHPGDEKQLISPLDERAVLQIYDSGDACNDDGERYFTQVRLACFLTKASPPEIVSVRWLSKCGTLVLMHSPGLCDADDERNSKLRRRRKFNDHSGEGDLVNNQHSDETTEAKSSISCVAELP